MNKNTAANESFINFSLAIDDTDSLEGMCTTYLGAKIFFHLYRVKSKIEIKNFPYLIRHNPNVPNRTKGNGSVVIRGKIDPSMISWLQSTVILIFNKFSHLKSSSTNPGLVIWYGTVSKQLQDFSLRALWDIIDVNELDKFLSLNNVFYYSPKNKNGLIGSLAGIGTLLNQLDYTFELLVYRNPPYSKTRINFNYQNVWNVDENDFKVFSCVDVVNKSIKIVPKGFDPVMCGIRGEIPESVMEYWNAIQPQPQPDFILIFKSNQGTDAHLSATFVTYIAHPLWLPYRVVKIVCKVISSPITELGGHVKVKVQNLNNNESIFCYAYEPSKAFRNIILNLIEGDLLEIAGNLRPANANYLMSLNIERIKIKSLSKKFKVMNPKCPNCGKRMESAGTNQPFRCKKCKKILNKKENLIKTEIKRDIKENTVYLPPIDSQRHLTKPFKRYNKNNNLNKKTNSNKYFNWMEKIIISNNNIYKTTKFQL